MNSTTNQGTALITGGSSGIGSVYADRLAHRGYDLILAAAICDAWKRSQPKLRGIGRKVTIIPGDLSNKQT